jgi:hypothetical protein
MGNIQGTQFMDYDNENAISLRVEFESDKKEAARGIVKTCKFVANDAKEICQFNKCKYDIEGGELTTNYYPSPVPPLDFTYRFVGKLKVGTTRRTISKDNNNKTIKYLDIEIYLYRRSMTDDSVEVEGTAIVGPFDNPIAKYKVNGALDYRLHMNDINSSVLFLEGRKI